MLLAGYAYAHGAARWPARPVAIRSCTRLCSRRRSARCLSRFERRALPAGGHPVPWLLLLLAATIGFRSSRCRRTHRSAALLSRTDHPAGRDPYFLYAASNLGSLLALAAYPTIVEPLLSVRAQTRLWAIGYTEFVVLIVACAVVVWRRPDASQRRRPDPR